MRKAATPKSSSEERTNPPKPKTDETQKRRCRRSDRATFEADAARAASVIARRNPPAMGRLVRSRFCGAGADFGKLT